jgi:hypothetical protein
MHTTQIAATNRVIRSRFFSTTLEPDRLDCMPPPNSEDSPPPLPLCSRMSAMSARLLRISRVLRNTNMGQGPS